MGLVLFLALLALVAVSMTRPLQFGPAETGELTVVALLDGRGPGRGSAGSHFQILVRVASGQEFRTSVGQPMSSGEHLWAVYSVAKDRNEMQVSSYKRCGMKPCPVTTESDAAR